MLNIFFGAQPGLDRCAALIRDYRAEQEAKRDPYADLEQMLREGLSDRPQVTICLMSLRRGQLLTEARLAWCAECASLLPRTGNLEVTARVIRVHIRTRPDRWCR